MKIRDAHGDVIDADGLEFRVFRRRLRAGDQGREERAS